MRNPVVLNEQTFKDISIAREVPRVAIMAPLDENGEIKLCKRWSEPFLEQDMEVIHIPVGSEYGLEALEHVDALLMPGGDSNIHPSTYKSVYNRKHKEVDDTYDQARDEYAFKLIHKAYELDLPTLGICRGMQEMVVAFGGALCRLKNKMHAQGYEHNGDHKKMDRHVHHIGITPGSLFAEIFKGRSLMLVNSIHKEGITRFMWNMLEMKKLRSTFQVTAMSPDKVVEGIVAKNKRFFIGVQAHFEFAGPKHDMLYNRFFTEARQHHKDSGLIVDLSAQNTQNANSNTDNENALSLA